MSHELSVPALQIGFFALIAIRLTVDLYLAFRQIRFVRASSHTVPAPFATAISAGDHLRTADYTVAKKRFSMLLDVADALLLLGWTAAGGLNWVLSITGRWTQSTLWSGTSFLLTVVLLSALLDLPASLYATFGIEARFGFNKSTFATYVLDRIKAALLLVVLGGPLILAVLFLMGKMGSLWWLYVWLVWTGFSLGLIWLYPAVIAPLFNKFRPLENPALLKRIESLLARVGSRRCAVMVMDGSKRSAHGNAYFTGFGRHRRIVFYDTLLSRLEDEEVEAVLAHELGHYRLRHVQWRLLGSVMGSLFGLAVLGWLSGQAWFYLALGVTSPSMAAALVLFAFLIPVVLFPLSPLSAWWSRRQEFAADRFATSQIDARSLQSALVKLYRENATPLTPDPWHSAFYDTHPPALTRIRALDQA